MSLSKAKRFKILTRDRFRCRYCGRAAPSVVLHVDHIHPVSRGGTDDETNLVTACVDCNSSKSGKLLPLDLSTPTQPETFPHVDRCGICRGARLYVAIDERPTASGFVALYRCATGHEWSTSWSNSPSNRLTKAELLEVAS